MHSSAAQTALTPDHAWYAPGRGGGTAADKEEGRHDGLHQATLGVSVIASDQQAPAGVVHGMCHTHACPSPGRCVSTRTPYGEFVVLYQHDRQRY